MIMRLDILVLMKQHKRQIAESQRFLSTALRMHSGILFELRTRSWLQQPPPSFLRSNFLLNFHE